MSVTSKQRRMASLNPSEPTLHTFPDYATPGPNDYWACERPEQPAVTGIWWDERCPRCEIAYEAARRTQPEMGVWHRGRLVPMAEVSWDRFQEMAQEGP